MAPKIQHSKLVQRVFRIANSSAIELKPRCAAGGMGACCTVRNKLLNVGGVIVSEVKAIAEGVVECWDKYDKFRIPENESSVDPPVVVLARAYLEMLKQSQLRLFVWTEFAPDYKCGLAFALAENAEQAQSLVEQSEAGNASDWGRVVEMEITPVAFSVYGSS